jgi:hypothetical protein
MTALMRFVSAHKDNNARHLQVDSAQIRDRFDAERNRRQMVLLERAETDNA